MWFIENIFITVENSNLWTFFNFVSTQENERLYKQMKELQIENKKNEERMFKENQCLKSELIHLR